LNPLPSRGILTDMNTVHAIFENGVFRPLERVELPESCEVEFEPRMLNLSADEALWDKIYEVMGREHSSGQHDVAARHNEHQP